MNQTIVIVGGGFCGTVLAANLLRRPPAQPTDILLIERGPEIGRGVAYAARKFPYLLNVPAARLSAESKDPAQFLRFVHQRIPDADGEDFLPRALYGEYLQEVLSQKERAAPHGVRLVRVSGEVQRISPLDGQHRFAVEFADRAPIPASRVILALGNPPPALLPWSERVKDHPAFRRDPWDLPENLTAQSSVLIVGNGLTMADAAVALSQDEKRAPQLQTLSRHGLVSLTQTTFRPSALRGSGAELLENAHSIRRVLVMCRDLSREVERRGGDWREVVTFIRNLAPALWGRLPEAERKRFLRHLSAHWDAHRHRLPPETGARIASLRRNGRLKVNAGNVASVEPAGKKLNVSWVARGQGPATQTMTVDLLVNAIGPDYVISRSADPLIRSLRAQGLVREDSLSLGLHTAEHGACVDARGQVQEHLFYLGPMLRAEHWESTAATELRNHAERLAAHLVDFPLR